MNAPLVSPTVTLMLIAPTLQAHITALVSLVIQEMEQLALVCDQISVYIHDSTREKKCSFQIYVNLNKENTRKRFNPY